MAWNMFKLLKFRVTNHQETTGQFISSHQKEIEDTYCHFRGSAVRSPGPME